MDERRDAPRAAPSHEGLVALRHLVEATSSTTGPDFFEALVQALPVALGVRYAFVGELDGPGPRRTRTVAAWWNGAPRASFEYDLAGTPCETVLAKGDLAYYPRDVATLFPQDAALRRLGIECYLGVPLRGSDGRYLGLLVVMDEDPLDERCDPESVLRIFADRAAAELQRRHDEARWRDAQQRLLEGQKFEALGRLAQGIVHDFRNLLSVVDGFVSLAEDPVSPGQRSRALQRAHAAAAQGAALLQRLQALGRDQAPRAETFDVGPRIRDAQELLGGLVAARIAIETIVCEPCWPIHTDPLRFDQLLVNLVVNARDAIRGTGLITISTSCDTLGDGEAGKLGLERGGDYLLLTVADTGVGMDAETRRRAGEPFFSTRTADGGTGLGLAICRATALQAGGALQIESSPGTGTRVVVAFPRAPRGPDETPGS